jgi:pimeloyl-ACP methyl ester carboxylesterase
MPFWTGFSRNLRALAAAGAITGTLAPGAAGADVIRLSDMLRGIAVTQAQCAAIHQTVWVEAMEQEFCIRYYVSTAGGQSERPTVFLQGDKLGRLNTQSRAFEPHPEEKDTRTDDLIRMADGFSKAARGTAIYLARPGIDGSAGDHRIRHSLLELAAMNAALDAIKTRHGFAGFHLVGQSGGATLAGALIGLRDDVSCAVLGSGMLAPMQLKRSTLQLSKQMIDATEAIPAIVQNSAMRVLVVTDREDKKVSLAHQAVFVEELRRAGGKAEHYFVEAADTNRHGVVAHARLALAGCIRGASEAAISERLAKIRQQVAARPAQTRQAQDDD